MLKKNPGWLLFLFFLAFYAFTARGYIGELDGETMFLVIEGIGERGDFSVEAGLMREIMSAKKGRGGKLYVYYEPAQPLFALPLYFLGKLVLYFKPDLSSDFVLRFFVSFFNSIVSALCMFFFYLFSCSHFLDRKSALVATFLLGLNTMFWFYSKSFFREPLVALFLLLFLHYLFFFSKEMKIKALFISGLFFGLMVFTRTVMGLLIFPVLGYIVLVGKGNKKILTPLLFFSLPVTFFVFLCLAYNFYRYENWFDFGQSIRGATSASLFKGITDMLFSSSKGLFLFNPLFLFAFPGSFFMWRQKKKEMMLFLALSLVVLFFFAQYPAWGSTWGPRFLLPIFPVLFVFVALYFQIGRKKRLVYFFGAISFLIQVLSIIPSQELFFDRIGLFKKDKELPVQEFARNWKFNPILGQVQSLLELRLSSMKFSADIHDPQFRKEFIKTPDFWWCYLYRLGYFPFLALGSAFLFLFVALMAGRKLLVLSREDESP